MSKKILYIALAALVVVNITLLLFYGGNKKTAFIDYNTVYNNCKLKVELEKDLKYLIDQRKSQLDSMQLQLSFLSQEISSGNSSSDKVNEFEALKERFLGLQQQYEQENIQKKEEYFNQIRKEVNDKAKAYAAKNGYDYFFAAMGDGALMYASESEDVTKDFQQYLDNN